MERGGWNYLLTGSKKIRVVDDYEVVRIRDGDHDGVVCAAETDLLIDSQVRDERRRHFSRSLEPDTSNLRIVFPRSRSCFHSD